MQFVSNSNVFGSCFIRILYTGCAKIKKNNSGAKRLSVRIEVTEKQFTLRKNCSNMDSFGR